MSSTADAYSVDQEVAAFFDQTSATRSACDLRAKELVGGDVTLVPIQGVCSYTVYAGHESSSVVQFRLRSLPLPLETARLASEVYGSLAPQVRFEGQVGENDAGKESLYVYVMTRMRGISRLDFILAHGYPEETPENRAKRLTLVTDVARFFARSWKAPQNLGQGRTEKLHQEYKTDLERLHLALPKRFRALIEDCLKALPSIMALPLVLTHKDFGDMNVLVDPDTCHLLGVIDWAEASIEPFGINLYSVQRLMGKFHLRDGYIRYGDHDVLRHAFWTTLRSEIDGWSDSTFRTIKLTMALGLLLSRGFTKRLANAPAPTPISDDKHGAYNMLHLDAWLLRPETKII